jgi:hypothetical protein
LIRVRDGPPNGLPAAKCSTPEHRQLAFHREASSRVHHGKPEIVNTDQGSQFTGLAITKHSIAVSMDGKGAWRDNVSVSDALLGFLDTARFKMYPKE